MWSIADRIVRLLASVVLIAGCVGEVAFAESARQGSARSHRGSRWRILQASKRRIARFGRDLAVQILPGQLSLRSLASVRISSRSHRLAGSL